MEKKKRNLTKIFGIAILIGYMLVAVASESSKSAYKSWDGSYGQAAVQGYYQASQGGTYLGVFESESSARAAAAAKGFDSYQYYPSTGNCFGY